MENVITIAELKQFIETNRSKLNRDSTLLMTKGDSFGFIKHQSYLNLTGFYDWVLENGEKIEGGYGDALAIWVEPNAGKIVFGEVAKDVARTHEDFFRNFMFDGYESVPRNLQRFEQELNRMTENEDAIVTGLLDDHTENPFGLIESVKIVEPDNVKLLYKDSYGHEKEKSPKYPMLILKMGESFTQEIKPKANESYKHIKKYNDFKS